MNLLLKTIFCAWTLSAQLPLIASAIDLDSLESMSAQGCQGIGCNIDCDAELAKRVNVDLPADIDTCHAKRQYRLLAKGLYLSKDGEIYSLEKNFQQLASKKRIALEGVPKQAVEDKVSPYVIDLAWVQVVSATLEVV